MKRKQQRRGTGSQRKATSRDRGGDKKRSTSSAFGTSGGQVQKDDGTAADPKAKSGRGRRSAAGDLRIIGGSMRGRTVRYHGSAYTRPMKDSVRENLFNILGPAAKGSIAFDFFAGNGAIAFEVLSRGAAHVTAIEQSRHALKFLQSNAEHLGVESKVRLLGGDAFRLAGRLLAAPEADTPWIVFLCPPFVMWEDEETLVALNEIIRQTLRNAPPGSVLIAETEKHFDVGRLPAADWDFREYGNVRLCFTEPAMVCGMNL